MGTTMQHALFPFCANHVCAHYLYLPKYSQHICELKKSQGLRNSKLSSFRLSTLNNPGKCTFVILLERNESPITNPHEIKKSATVFDLSKFFKCQVLPIWRNHVHPFQILTPLGSPFAQIDVIPVHLSLIDRCTQSDRRSSAPFGKSSGIVQRPK